jgi:23S rRNA pseudouridine1911/1915/1917 synthase
VSTTINNIVEQIIDSYHEQETDGVLNLAVSTSMVLNEELDIENVLVPAILESLDGEKNKGAVASIMNAMIGSCCFLATDVTGTKNDLDGAKRQLLSDRVDQLLMAYELLEENNGISPDIVSYCLAYTALNVDPNEQDLSRTILERAQRWSKKLAGGKRRKALASSRRKSVSTFIDQEESLKGLLGNDFEVLLENEDLAVINKPSGCPCFHRKTTTAGKIKKKKGKQQQDGGSDISLEDALIDCNIPLSTLNPDAMGLVHRLDRGSSGCMVLAKSDEMHAQLVSEFFLRRTTKKYTTLLDQTSVSSISGEEGLIEYPVNGRPARSKYRVLERYLSSNIVLMEFEIFTGRKHQIRVHAAKALSSPVLNDDLYSVVATTNAGKNGNSADDTSQRFYLHSSHLKIDHLGIDVKARIPSWWNETLSSLKKIDI